MFNYKVVVWAAQLFLDNAPLIRISLIKQMVSIFSFETWDKFSWLSSLYSELLY